MGSRLPQWPTCASFTCTTLALLPLLGTVIAGCDGGHVSPEIASAKSAHVASLALYRSGDRHGGDAKAHEAIDLYTQGGAHDPALSALHYETLVTLVEEDRVEEAEASSRAWLVRFPDDLLHRETLGKLLFRSGRYTEAAKELETLVRLKPGDIATRRRIVEARAFEGARDESLRGVHELLLAAGLSPLPDAPPSSPPRSEEAECLATAAKALSRFHEHAEAAPLWQRLSMLRPADTVARLELGLALKSLGRHAEALATLLPIHGDPKLGAEALRASAACHARESRHGESAKLLLEALERDPTSAEGYHQLADALRRLGNEKDASPMEKAATNLAASDRERTRVSEHRASGRFADALFAEAQSLAFAGRYRDADETLSRPELRRRPDVALRKAQLYLDWLRVKEAADILEALSRGSGGSMESVETLLRKARFMLEEPRQGAASNDATLELRRSIARTTWPQAAPLLVDLARAESAQDPTQAVAAARLAVAADPSSVEARRALARVLDRPEEIFYCLEAWKSLLAVVPADPEAATGVEKCRSRLAGLFSK